MTLMLENQLSKALLYGQKALVVARAAKLQSSHLYAVLLNHMLNICMKLESGLGIGHGEHAVPFEGFIAAVAQVKLTFPSSTAEWTKIDIFSREHTGWVKELQAELVRCVALHSSMCAAAELCMNILRLALSTVIVGMSIA